jgi:hypothetical protein
MFGNKSLICLTSEGPVKKLTFSFKEYSREGFLK